MTTNSLVPFRSFPCSLVEVKTRPKNAFSELEAEDQNSRDLRSFDLVSRFRIENRG